MSFDIEKRFRFVSSDDINDDINESHYQDDKIDDLGDEEEEKGKKPRILEEENPGENDFDEFKNEEDEEEDEEDEDFT